MSTQAILVLALPLLRMSEANPGIFDDTPGKGLISGITSSAMGTLNKYVLDKVDAKIVADNYNPIFLEIKKKLSTSSCVAGVHTNINNNNKVLTLKNGNMTELNKISMTVNMLEDDADSVTAAVKFTFRAVPIKYDFKYLAYRIVTMEREGHVYLKQEGFSLEFTVVLPKTQSRINQMLNENTCVAKVRNFNTDISKKHLSCENVNYESLANSFGLGITGRSIQEIVVALENSIRKNIEDAMQLLVEPTFRGFSFNCKDASYIVPIGAEAHKAIDCNHVKEVKNVKV